MKRILIFLFLILLFVFLFASSENTPSQSNEEGVNFWGIAGFLVIMLIVLGGGSFFFLLLIYSGRNDSGQIRISENAKLNLRFKEFFNTEEDEINLKFVIRRIVGNKVTLQCEICKGTHQILTKTIGFDKTKGITRKIKKLLNYPIDISVSPSEKGSLLIEAERVVPGPSPEFFLTSNTEIDGF